MNLLSTIVIEEFCCLTKLGTSYDRVVNHKEAFIFDQFMYWDQFHSGDKISLALLSRHKRSWPCGRIFNKRTGKRHTRAVSIAVEKLESVLLKAMQYLHMIKRDFVFQFRKNQFRISCDDIVYFEKKGRQAVIHTISENFKANMTTEEIWKQLDDKVFAHIHVSYIINLGHIRAIEGDEVVMDNEERLLIARSHKQNLKEKHMEFVRRMV